MNCDEIRDRIAVAAATGAPFGAEVDEHLASCAACRAEVPALRASAAVLGGTFALEESAERRAPFFSGRRSGLRRRLALVGAVAAAAALIVVTALREPSAPRPPEAPVAAWSGTGRVVADAPGRFRLIEGGADFVALGPFTVETPLARIRGDGPAEFSLLLTEVPGMSQRAKKTTAATAVAAAVVLIVSVQSGWLDVTPADSGPVRRVGPGETTRVDPPEPLPSPEPAAPRARPAVVEPPAPAEPATPPRPLRCRVVNWRGGKAGYVLMLKPAEGAVLRFRGEVPEDGMIEQAAPAPGTYDAFVTIGGWITKVTGVEVAEAGPTEFTVTMPEGVRVAGRILGPDGKPVASGTVSLDRETPEGHTPRGAVGADGTFELVGVPPGTWRLCVTHGGQYVPGVIEGVVVPDSGLAGLEGVLPAGGGIEGKMTGDLPAPPFRRVALARRMESGWKRHGSVAADGEGRFHARYLPPGRYRVDGEDALGMSKSAAELVEVEVGPNETVKGVELRFRKRGAVAVRLVTPSGARFREKVSGILVEVAEGTSQSRMISLAPDEEGRSEISSLRPGRWRLSILGGPEQVYVTEFTVPEDPSGPVEIRMWE